MYRKTWHEVVVDQNGSVKLYDVAESNGERISGKSINIGFVNGNRYDPEAKTIEMADDGYLFKGNKMEAIIIVLICGNFK